MHGMVEIPSFTPDFSRLAERVRLDLSPDCREELADMVKEAGELLRPRGVWRCTYIDKTDSEGFESEGRRFTSALAAKQLSTNHRIFPYLVSCGPEIDLLPLEGRDMLSPFWLDQIKQLALNAALKALREDLNARLSPGRLSSMNPGSGNREVWQIEDQGPLFDLIGEENRTWCGVELTDSFLMKPNKSLSGFFFSSEINYESCSYCDRVHCPDRRSEKRS